MTSAAAPRPIPSFGMRRGAVASPSLLAMIEDMAAGKSGGPGGSARSRRLYARGREGRAKILATTLDLVEERGYEGATMAELARRTELPASSIYWHFENKDELVAAALADSFEQRLARGRPWPEAPDERPLREQLAEALLGLATEGSGTDYNRVGLVVALPRTTAAVTAKKAFLTVREYALGQIADWWAAALAGLGMVDESRLATAGEVMGRLTIGVLDGRFLAIQDAPLGPQENLLLADMLVGIARYIAEGAELPDGDPLDFTPEGLKYPDPEPLTGADRLVAAAIGAICDYGVPGTTVAKVCARAKLPASSLYWHFKDLDALIEQALATSFAAWENDVEARARIEPGDPAAALFRGFASMRHQPTAFLIGYGLLLRREDSSARRRFNEIRATVLRVRFDWFRNWLSQDVPEVPEAEREQLSDVLARITLLASDGIFLVEALMPRWPLTRAGEFLGAGLREAAVRWKS